MEFIKLHYLMVSLTWCKASIDTQALRKELDGRGIVCKKLVSLVIKRMRHSQADLDCNEFQAALIRLTELKQKDSHIRFHFVTDSSQRFQALYLSHSLALNELRLTASSHGCIHSDDTFNLSNEVEVCMTVIMKRVRARQY